MAGHQSLQSVNIPSTITELSYGAFKDCSNLVKVQLNEGLQIIGGHAFEYCSALRSVAIPSTVSKLGGLAFYGCSNLSEVILLGGKKFLYQEFFTRGIFSKDQGLFNQGKLSQTVSDEFGDFAFRDCPLTAVKVSISWALVERMARLPQGSRLLVEERICNLPNLELALDGNVFACFHVTRRACRYSEDLNFGTEADFDDILEVCDTDIETARSLHQLLQLIAFYEIKESSILIELAVWKSRIDGSKYVPRAGCRVPIPDPAKSLIMEYCGFTGFLKPAIEGV